MKHDEVIEELRKAGVNIIRGFTVEVESAEQVQEIRERLDKLASKPHKVTQSDIDILPTIIRKSLLNKTKVEYGDYSINHVQGCAHDCKYPCYAKNLAKRFGWLKSGDDWRYPRLVGNALELLDKEIPKRKGQIDYVHLSFMCDPFMYDLANNRVYPQVQDLTLKIIEKLNQHRIKVTVLTKGVFPDDLCDKAVYGSENWYGITLVSLDPAFLKQYEPFAAPVADRIRSLKTLSEKGLKTWVSIEPYPTPNIVQQGLSALLGEVSFVNTVIFGRMNYNRLVGVYKEHKEFYEACVEQVRKFCDARNIKSYIKKGTPGSMPDGNKMFGEAMCH